jgi:hypothetical protein
MAFASHTSSVAYLKLFFYGKKLFRKSCFTHYSVHSWDLYKIFALLVSVLIFYADDSNEIQATVFEVCLIVLFIALIFFSWFVFFLFSRLTRTRVVSTDKMEFHHNPVYAANTQPIASVEVDSSLWNNTNPQTVVAMQQQSQSPGIRWAK